jgi:hypothetical protein
MREETQGQDSGSIASWIPTAGYALSFEESGKKNAYISTSLRPWVKRPSLLAPSPEARPGTYNQIHDARPGFTTGPKPT